MKSSPFASAIILLCASIGCAGGSASIDDGQLTARDRALTAREHPDDHTLFFRKNHAQAAASADAKCGKCHVGLSESARDSCQECHSTLEPRDHRLRWRGTEHGRSAGFDSSRCATCHEVDYCTSCHSIAPPNHRPVASFRYRHERVARANERSCQTCHTFEATCSECHTLDVSPFSTTIGNLAAPLSGRRR